MAITFKLPESFTVFNYKKIFSDAKIERDGNYQKPVPILVVPGNYYNDEKVMLPIMTRGNISCIQGKAKARKTYYITLLCYLIAEQKGLRMVIFDTEQCSYYSQKIITRLDALTSKANIELFRLRKYEADVKMDFVLNYIEENKPDVVFIDNIKDCMSDINSQTETSIIKSYLLKLVDEFDIHCCVTIHENPGKDNDKARGSIGTELQNVCETIFRLEKDESFTKVKAIFCRSGNMNEICFDVDHFGNPNLRTDVLENEKIYHNTELDF